MNPRSQLISAIVDKIRIRDIEMIGADLVNAELSNLQADRLNLRSANMCGAKLRASYLGYCLLEGATFEDADFTDAVLRMCRLDRGQGAGACFNNARIEDSTAKGACLPRVAMKGAKLTETSFERAILREAVLDSAVGDGMEFRGADLNSASLISVEFNDADFRGADLRSANLSKGCFRDADFRGALLDGTLFESADLYGAVFDVGAEPYAVSNDSNTKESGADELANTVVTLLGDNLAELPDVLAENKELITDIIDRLQQANTTFKDTSKYSSEEWKQWIEAFLALAKDESEIELETIVKALYEGPIELQNLLTLNQVSRDDMLDRIRHLSETLNSAAAEPPDEWKPILEPLMKKAKAGEAIDFKTIIKLLSVKN